MNDYEALLSLQDIDLRLIRISRQLKAMPQERKIQMNGRSRKRLASELSKIVGLRKDAQMELDEADEARAHLVDVQAEVRERALAEIDHRQILSFEEQLSSLAKKMEKSDHGRPARLEALRKLERAESNTHALLERLDEQKRALEASLKDESADLMGEAKELAERRRALSRVVGPEVMGRYEAALRRFGGLAVERLDGAMPSVCRVSLRPSQVAALVRGSAIAECPYCHRMLVTTSAAGEGK
ncbi:zinc ribbon domain-containing protein [Olsenella sp. HMSC062G07]|uniref:zinc ribbon domain-containing protein n=1 Tax=Olsenella sp. HMSC062G07 TaxID=1739330 RepID=UPI0008A2DBB8|nr:hypothetical protein [Olsenella sp. HMSC062G07]OFK24404.1 hypothetical protein HMPREF2826_07370 [Olsenella sp. HMSC062G07]